MRRAAQIYYKISMERRNLRHSNLFSAQTALIDYLAARRAKSAVIPKNAACAWKIKVSFGFPLLNVFFVFSFYLFL